VLALAGAFWIGLGVGMAGMQGHWVVSTVGTVVQVGGAVGLIRAARRLRRRSGFQRSELRQLDGIAETQKRHIIKWFAATTLGETLLSSLLVWTCLRFEAEHLIWASIGVIVSLHFVPLGKIFHVRTYYVTAIAGTIVSGAGFLVSATPDGVAFLGVSMAAVMWLSAAYILLNADRIADQACAEHWAV
jgi:uncharacterized membrane protein YhiD involved in acid resistance